jgi:hypothetical protein
MIRTLVNTTAAELVKLWGLPGALATIVGTVASAIALTAAVAAASPAPTGAVRVTLLTIPFLQIGPILIGILAVATEYAGGQIRTTLTATPCRLFMLAGKTLAYLATAAVTSAAAIAAGLAASAITLAVHDTAPTGDTDAWPVAGATVYLVLLGLLGFALTILLRSLIPPLVTMLSLVLIISPLVSGNTGYARWLPDRAGSLLYLPTTDPAFTPGTGTLVLLAWIITAAIPSIVALLARDA